MQKKKSLSSIPDNQTLSVSLNSCLSGPFHLGLTQIKFCCTATKFHSITHLLPALPNQASFVQPWMSQDAVGSLWTGAAISLKRLASFLCSAGTFLCMDIQLETPCDSLHSKCRLSHARIRPGSNSVCAFLKSQGQHWHVFIGTVHNM